MSIKRSLPHDRRGAEQKFNREFPAMFIFGFPLSLFLFSRVRADYSFATISVRQSRVAVALNCHFTVCVASWLIAIRCKNGGKLHRLKNKKKIKAFFSAMSSAQCLLKTRQIMCASGAPFAMLLAAAVHSFCACSTLLCYKSGLFILFLFLFPQIHFFLFWLTEIHFFLPSECVKNSVSLFFSHGCETSSGLFHVFPSGTLLGQNFSERTYSSAMFRFEQWIPFLLATFGSTVLWLQKSKGPIIIRILLSLNLQNGVFFRVGIKVYIHSEVYQSYWKSTFFFQFKRLLHAHLLSDVAVKCSDCYWHTSSSAFTWSLSQCSKKILRILFCDESENRKKTLCVLS